MSNAWRELIDLPNESVAVATRAYLLERGATDDMVRQPYLIVLASAEPDMFPMWCSSIDRVRELIENMMPSAKLFANVGAGESAEALLATLRGEAMH